MKLSAQLIPTLSIITIALSATPVLASQDVTEETTTTQRVTSRQVVRNFENLLFTRPHIRSEAKDNDTGRTLLRVRSAWRQPGLRNQNRHMLGLERGGEFGNVTRLLQGDDRRRGVVATETDEELPPSLVTTGQSTSRPSRRAIRGDRNLNNENRR